MISSSNSLSIFSSNSSPLSKLLIKAFKSPPKNKSINFLNVGGYSESFVFVGGFASIILPRYNRSDPSPYSKIKSIVSFIFALISVSFSGSLINCSDNSSNLSKSSSQPPSSNSSRSPSKYIKFSSNTSSTGTS